MTGPTLKLRSESHHVSFGLHDFHPRIPAFHMAWERDSVQQFRAELVYARKSGITETDKSNVCRGRLNGAGSEWARFLSLTLAGLRPASGLRVYRVKVSALHHLIGPSFFANLLEPAERLSIVAGGFSSIAGQAKGRGQ
jgi:hypothetical protein